MKPNLNIRCARFIVIFFALLGCAQQQLSLQESNFNKGLADFIDKQIFLNIVRASKSFPRQFVVFGDFTAQDAVNATADASFPFIDGVLSLTRQNAGVNFSSGISNFKI